MEVPAQQPVGIKLQSIHKKTGAAFFCNKEVKKKNSTLQEIILSFILCKVKSFLIGRAIDMLYVHVILLLYSHLSVLYS